MRIDVRGLSVDSALRARIGRQMAHVVGRLKVRPVAAQVAFFDDSGPRGGIVIRCTLTIRLPYRPSVRVEEVAGTPRQAFDSGFVMLERRLRRSVDRHRDSRRHPKKYFLAKRLLEARVRPRTGKRRATVRRRSGPSSS